MLKKIAHWIVERMDKYFQRSETEKIELEYMTEVILDQILIIIISLIICGFLGYWRESLMCFTGCILIRNFAGGIHFKTRWACILTTSSVAVVGGFIVHNIKLPLILYVALLVFDLLFAYIFAPQGTENSPISPKFRMIKKYETIISLGIFMLILLIFKNEWGKGLCLGGSFGIISIIPLLFSQTRKKDA